MFTRRAFFFNAAVATIAAAGAARAAEEHAAVEHEAAPAPPPKAPAKKQAALKTPPPPEAAAAADGDACAVPTPELQKATSPLAAVKMLKDGNARFVSGKPRNCDVKKALELTSQGQAPIAAVVSCVESRVPPEIIFDQQLGDIFCARVAGNFVNDDIIGSLEYATRVAGARAIVVLGHTSCGAIKGAIDGAKLGLLTKTLENIRPAIEMSSQVEGDRTSSNRELVQTVAEANVMLNVMKLTEKSDIMKSLIIQRQLLIVGAMHDIHTGEVTWLS